MSLAPPRRLGLLPLVFVAVHLALRIRAGHPEDALWLCHVADVLLGVGLLAGQPRVWGVGAVWIFWGTPLWLLDVLGGGAFRPTSLGTHFGALVVAFAAARLSPFPKGIWWRAILGVWVLLGVTRLLVVPTGNLNLAFAVQPDQRAIFTSYPPYFAFVSAVATGVFALAEALFRRLGPTPASLVGTQKTAP